MSSDTDPFLQHHRCAPLEFSIAGPLLPISILDQARRGVDFVEAALATGILAPDRPPLLVVGAGVGGVSAALLAAKSGSRVLLVEKQQFPFSLQRESYSRVLHPRQYDWPMNGWDETFLAAEGEPYMPLPWDLDKAHRVAGAWERELEIFVASHTASIQFARSTTWVASAYHPGAPAGGPQWDGKSFDPPPPTGCDLNLYYGHLTASFHDSEGQPVAADPSGHPFPLQFAAVLYATGFGPERRVPGGFRGLDFWDNDNFEEPNLGFPSLYRAPRILVSGSGDGALQDFLRLATGKSTAAEIFQHLFRGLAPRVLQDFPNKIEQAEKVFNPVLRHGTKAEKHQANTELDAVYLAEIDALLDRDRNTDILTRLDQLLRHSHSIELLLIYPCRHLTAFYGLNRFLVHLCRAAVELDPQRFKIEFWPEFGLDRVHGANGHKCPKPDPDPGPEPCRNQPHSAQLAPKPRCIDKILDPTGPEQPFNLIVVRHGIDSDRAAPTPPRIL